MPIRLATQADRPALVALYNATPLRTALGPISGLDPRFLLADAFIVVNEANNGALTACAIVTDDNSSATPMACINFVFGSSVAAIRPVMREIAVRARNRGYTQIYGCITMHPALAAFRTYLEARFSYVGMTANDPDLRCMAPTCDQMEALG